MLASSSPPPLLAPLRAWMLAVVASVVVFGCAQIIGADDERELLPLMGADGDGGRIGEDPEIVPGASEPGACAPGEKRCNGACVPKSVEYGCGSDDCTPCSLPNVEKVVCKDDQCAAATCRPGFGACGEPTEGCEADLSSPATCTSCLIACNVDSGQVCNPSGCGSDCGALTNCAGACVDLDTAPNHCGTCGNRCPEAENGDAACEDGKCIVECRQGFAHCDGDPTGPCTALQVFYRDADGDGYGVTGETKLACNAAEAGAGWAAKAGDCHDGNKDVFPGQTILFKAPYAIGGTYSYDYDCNGREDSFAAEFMGCTNPDCSNAGFVPEPSGRSGPGVNDLCGSTRYVYCDDSDVIEPFSLRPLAPEAPLKPFCMQRPSAGGPVGCR